MLALPSVDGYKDAVADLVGFAVARGDFHTGVEVNDVLPPRCRVPVEVVSRRDFAENDAGRRQALRKLSPAGFLGPFDLDVPEMRLAARIGVEVVYPHRRVSLETGFEAAF